MTCSPSESGVTFHFQWKTSRRFPGIPFKKEKTQVHLTDISGPGCLPSVRADRLQVTPPFWGLTLPFVVITAHQLYLVMCLTGNSDLIKVCVWKHLSAELTRISWGNEIGYCWTLFPWSQLDETLFRVTTKGAVWHFSHLISFVSRMLNRWVKQWSLIVTPSQSWHESLVLIWNVL